MDKKTYDILELTRHACGMINLADLKKFDENSSQEERRIYLGNAEMVFVNPAFQNEIKKIMEEQKDFVAMSARTMDEVSVARGVMNALCLLEERFTQLHNEFKSKSQVVKKFNRFNMLPE